MSAQPNKLYCEDCKIQVPKFLWGKHVYSLRHLRAKAARMFYSLRKKHDSRKKQKVEEIEEPPAHDNRYIDYEDAMGPSGVSKSEAVTSKAKPAGVWCVLIDLATDLKYYKNRISGKTQRNKPVGLNEADLDVEYIDTVEEKAEVESEPVDVETISKLGGWQEVQPSYFFGEDLGSDEEEANSAEAAPAVQAFSDDESYHESQSSDEGGPFDQDLLVATEQLKHEAEEEPVELVEKPVYERKMETSSTFTKRPKKAKLQV
mmetsp:Transcript_1965/g.4384  ORF Transcript_1965/g.4384 Transcript_1965/m.4384 type:complete len:260 (+) Transcript_1965:59-838(+)